MDDFWGDTPLQNVYDIGVLLAYPHEYMTIDRKSPAWQLLHELFMRTLPFDPFDLPNSGTDAGEHP